MCAPGDPRHRSFRVVWAVLPEYGAEVMECSSTEVGYNSDELKDIQTRLRGTMVGWGTYGPGMLDGRGGG